MFESEADRLDALKAVGAQLVDVDGSAVWAVFTAAHIPLQFGDHVMDSSDPQIMARASDLSELVDTSIIRIGAKDYRVAAIEPDGIDGNTTVRLRE